MKSMNPAVTGVTAERSYLEGRAEDMAGLAVTMAACKTGEPGAQKFPVAAALLTHRTPAHQDFLLWHSRLASMGRMLLRGRDLEQAQPRPRKHPLPFPTLSSRGKGHSPIWDCATSVEVRSHSGEKGRPSSASLSPWREDGGTAGGETSDYQIQAQLGATGGHHGRRGISAPLTQKWVISK